MQGGFLFTTVASCLQWPSTQNGHWSAAAFFYACMLLAFVAVVMGSQQLLVLPDEAPSDWDASVESNDRYAKEMKESEKLYLLAVVGRLRERLRDDRPDSFQVFALQAPLMLLTSSVMAFLAGLCSVVFAPLANQPGWNDNAKVCCYTLSSSTICQLLGTDRGCFRRGRHRMHRRFLQFLAHYTQAFPLGARL